jgi:inner membrane protein involved in colicin E2 resistance
MTSVRIGAILLIFVVVSSAWAILAGSMSFRTSDAETGLRPKVEGLWGSPQAQLAPQVTMKWKEMTRTWNEQQKRMVDKEVEREEVASLASSDISVQLGMDFRRKGLLWYSTYEVEFDGSYTVVNDAQTPRTVAVKFFFPDPTGNYDDFEFSVGGNKARAVGQTDQGLLVSATAQPGASIPVKVHYRSRGLDTWEYRFAQTTTQVSNCNITVHTDFHRVNFPDRSMSPTEKAETADGWALNWSFESLVTGLGIGVEMPEKLDPGPWAARVSAFAPIGLLFFLAVLVIIGIVTGINPHPMHYMFVCAAFFAFHLLLAYLVDHVDANAAFALAGATSIVLVVSYLIRAMGARFTFQVALPAQLVFLVLFSYSFFYPGYTGLSITIGAILTLFALMQITAKVDWAEKFGSPGAAPPPAPPSTWVPPRQ